MIEYSKIYSKTSGDLWNYFLEEPNNNNINYSIKDSKSFDYRTSIRGKFGNNNTKKEMLKFLYH